VTSFNMTVMSNLQVGSLTFTISNCVLSYTSQPGLSLFTMTGDAALNLPDVGNVTVDFGGTGTQGIVVTNGSLTTFNMTTAVDFSLAGFHITGGLIVSYLSSTAAFALTGSANADFLGTGFSIVLGGSGTQGLVIQNGKLTSFDMTLSGQINIVNVIYVNVSTTVTYNASLGEFTLSGTGGLSLQVPSFLQFAMGDTLVLGSVGFNLVDISGDNADSYVQFYTTVLDISVGIQVNFNGVVSLKPGIDVLDALKNAFNQLGQDIVAGWNDFVSLFGPLAGATVYYDANNNLDFAQDPSAVTASNGSFHLAIPAGSTTGQIVVVGGTDQSTGLANAAILTAPLGATTITPFSTLVNDIEQQTGASEGAAIADVQRALGISTTINPLADDYIKQALGGDANAASTFASEVQLTALSYQVDSLLSGAGGGTPASISTALFKNVASTIAQSGGAPLNLTDPAVVLALIQATATSVNVTLDPALASGAATIVAGVNHYIAALQVSGSAAYVNQVIQAQVVAEKTIAPLLAQAGAGTANINTVVAEETGMALAAQIAAATIGSVNLDGPTVIIANQVRQPVGNGDPATMQFSVYLATTAPLTQAVSVHYTTQDGTATAANGDYTPESGTLTWQPGDTAPKTITVGVNPTSPIAADKLFEVVLSNAVNAGVESAVGVGDIEYTDIATTTTLITSTAAPTFGQGVMLTATVTNQDAAKDAGTGSVTFSDGTTVLGTAPLVNGVATLMTTALNAGPHNVSAAYAGQLQVGEQFDPSNSPLVLVTVAPAVQTIDFGALAEQTYGGASIFLSATASSGLPVTFSLLAGLATLAGGDVLTITGAGAVSVEADQGGDSNDQAAPAVVQSFNVKPATLTFTADNQVMTYGGTLPTLTGHVTSGFVNGDNLGSLTAQPTLITVGANSHVGSYAIVASGAVAPNYTFIYVPGTLTITQAPLTIAADDQSMVVGSAVPLLTASYFGLVNGDTSAALATPPTLSTTATSASPIDFYDITAGGAAAPDYAISYVDGALNVALEAPTTDIETTAAAFVYGQSATFTVTASGDQGTATGSVQFQIHGVNFGTPVELSDGSADLTTTALPAGSDALTAVYSSNSNNYTDGSTTTLTETVSPAGSVTTVADVGGTYYGSSFQATSTVTGAGGLNAVASSLDYYDIDTSTDLGSTAPTNAGHYTVAATYNGDANHFGSSSGALAFTISQATASVVVTPYTGSYDGTAHSATYAITGVNGETGATVGSVDVSNTTHTNAGTYANDSWSFTGANYNDIASTTITDIIDKAAATITVTPYSVTYDGNGHAATYAITGVNGETGATVGSVALSTTHINAGTYASDSWSFAGTANYHSIASTTVTDIINKANATFTVTPYNLTYNGGAHTAAVSTITGVNGETGATVGSVTLNTTHINAGGYADTWSFTGTANYNAIVNSVITDTINQAQLTVAANPQSKTYGQTLTFGSGSTQFTSSGLVNGQTIGSVTLAVSNSGGAASAPAGSYTITPSAAAGGTFTAGNYAISYVTGALSVIQSSIIILNSTAAGALSLSGNAFINVNSAVVVDSNSTTALTGSGNASVKASVIDVVGNDQKSGNATFSPAPVTGAAVEADPFLTYAEPSTTGLTNYGAANIGGNSSATLKPGIYTQINVSGNAAVTLAAGTFLIEGGGFNVSGNATVQGSGGVTIFNAGSAYPSTGGSYGAINVSGNAGVALTAPGTGTYTGIVFFQSRDNRQPLQVSGNAIVASPGTVYLPDAPANVSGNAMLETLLVVNTLSLSGNADPSSIPYTKLLAEVAGRKMASGLHANENPRLHDILTGYTTTFYINEPALLAVLTEWNSGESYPQRIPSLPIAQVTTIGQTIKPNDSYRAGYLLNAATVDDNDETNHLEGDVDGYFASLSDKLDQLRCGEVFARIS
jgi:hypothetical protein